MESKLQSIRFLLLVLLLLLLLLFGPWAPLWEALYNGEVLHVIHNSGSRLL